MPDEQTNTTTPTAEELEAEKLFSEFSAARAEGKEVSEVIGSPAPAEPQPVEPEPKPATEQAPPQEPQSPPPAPSQAAPAPIDWSVLPPAVREAFEQKENDRRAAIGRAAAAQRKADLLQRQIQAPPPASAAAVDEPSKLQKEFPELDEAVDKKMQAREAKLADLLDRRIEEATTKVKADTLEAVFPGWHKTMQSDQFQYWLTQQGDDAQKKWEGSSVGDYAALLNDFTKHQSAPPPSTAAADILAERQARLRTATSVEGRNIPANRATGEPDPNSDGEAYFNYLAKKGERERASLRR